MKSRFLKYLYLHNRSLFYRFFVDEFFEDIPNTVAEPAMTFLSQGRERLEKWALFQARMLQSRIVDDPDRIKEYQGMLSMLKLLMVHTVAPTKKPPLPTAKPKPERDDIAEAEAAVKEIKKGLSTAITVQKKE